MPTAPLAFPLLGAPGDDTPERGNSLKGRSPEAGGKIQLPRHTRPDPRRSQHGRLKCDPKTECSSYKKQRCLFHAPPNVKVWHKTFFWLVRAQGRSPHAPGISQKCLRHVKGSTGVCHMSPSLLLQQFPACLVYLTWIVFVIGGKWPYSSCFVGCFLQDLFNIACSILV